MKYYVNCEYRSALRMPYAQLASSACLRLITTVVVAIFSIEFMRDVQHLRSGRYPYRL